MHAWVSLLSLCWFHSLICTNGKEDISGGRKAKSCVKDYGHAIKFSKKERKLVRKETPKKESVK